MNELADRFFTIWAYTVSHGFLILRSPLKFPDQDDFDERHTCNIDIEFTAVEYLDIPSTMRNLEIRELIDNIPEKFIRYKTHNYKVFELKSDEGLFYIVAGSYRIGKNTWLNQDRIFNMGMGLEYDSIIETS